MKKIFVFITILYSVHGFTQALNSFEYLIIPSKFTFQKVENQYGLNSLMEAYFKQQGFTVVFDKNVTTAMNSDRCNAIYASVLQQGSMFSTKIIVELKDCDNRTLLVSPEGVSRAKEYNIAYNEAMRMALKSIPNQNYVFAARASPTAVENKPEKPVIETTNNTTKNDNLIVVETLANGFLLIDSTTSKVILKLYNTNSKDVFIGIANTTHGVATRTNGKIIFEYIDNNVLTSKIFNVKL